MSSEINTTRNRILDAAWSLLESNQGSGVRMSDIAKQAGISRQALYLHFKTRSKLLIATVRYIDEIKEVEARFDACCHAKSGSEKLDLFITAWGNYIPEIYPVAKALLAMKDTDKAASSAWDDRMQAVREGCKAIIMSLKDEQLFSLEYNCEQATDILWTMLSVRNWEQLTIECDWSQKKYIKTMKSLTQRVLNK